MTTSWSWHEFHDRKSIINFKSRTSNFKNWISNTWFLTEMKRKDIVCLTKYRTRKNVQSMIGSLSRIVRVDRWFVLEKSPVTWDGNILHLYGSNLPLTKIGFEKIKFIFELIFWSFWGFLGFLINFTVSNQQNLFMVSENDAKHTSTLIHLKHWPPFIMPAKTTG